MTRGRSPRLDGETEDDTRSLPLIGGAALGVLVAAVGLILLGAAIVAGVIWSINGSEPFHDPAALAVIGFGVAIAGFATTFACYELVEA